MKPMNSFSSGSKIRRKKAAEIVYSIQKETSLFMSVLFSVSCEAVAVCEAKYGAVIMKAQREGDCLALSPLSRVYQPLRMVLPEGWYIYFHLSQCGFLIQAWEFFICFIFLRQYLTSGPDWPGTCYAVQTGLVSASQVLEL